MNAKQIFYFTMLLIVAGGLLWGCKFIWIPYMSWTALISLTASGAVCGMLVDFVIDSGEKTDA